MTTPFSQYFSWIVIILLIPGTCGQQFDGYISPYETLGLSDGCLAAVNTTIHSCPAWLPHYAGIEGAGVEILASEQLKILCESSCVADLKNLRTSITGACTKSSDVMVPYSIAYPATFLVDRYLYTSSLSCLKDKSSGEYCDIVVSEWVNQTNYTSAQTCSYCELGIQQIQLSSPFGYSEVYAETFANTTASCNQGGYAFATPTTYALNSSAPIPPPTCTGTSYTIQEEDTCVSISAAYNISTYELIAENSLNLGCNNLPSVGESICAPPQSCSTTYQLELFDTCETLSTSWGATLAQIQAWNPIINSPCSNLASWRGWYLCSSSPSGTITVGAGDAVITAAPVPTDAQGQSNTNCGTWYFVNAGEDCSSISLKFSLSLEDFYFLNPQVDHVCSNLWADTSYCVKAVGSIFSYPGYTTATAATTFTRPATATVFVPSPVATATLKPIAPDTTSGCYLYENAFDVTSKIVDLAAANTCDKWAQYVGVTVQELIEWNPSLTIESCVLQSDHSYCIQLWETRPIITYPFEYCDVANLTRIPATSLQPSDCTCYTNFRAQDKAIFNCSMIPDTLGITEAQLASLNPWIGSSCDTDIWSQMTNDGYEQLCVQAVSGFPTATIRSSSVPASTATATSTAPNTACTAAVVTFNLSGALAQATNGETVHIAGSAPELGSWAFEDSVPLSFSGSFWEVSVSFALGEYAEYKYYWVSDHGVVVWSSEPNYVIIAPTACSSIKEVQDVWR